MRRVLVAGDGPAGCLCAWLFSQSGHQVTRIGHRVSRKAAQSVHIHVLGPEIFDLAAQLDAGLARALENESEPDWSFFTPQSAEPPLRAPYLSRDALMRVLRPLSPLQTAKLPKGWDTDFDLVVDASGAARAIMRLAERHFGLELTVEDCGALERYATWQGQSQNAGKLFFRGMDPARFYVELSGWNWRLTVIHKNDEPPLNAQQVQNLLLGLGILPQGEFDSRPASMLGMPARRLCFTGAPQASGLKIMPFGDALIQTSPSLGFGIVSVFQQALILQKALSTDDFDGAIDALAAYADELWMDTALSQLGL